VSVVVYVADKCPHCRRLLDDLRRRSVDCTVVDLDREPRRIAEVVGLSWDHRVPLVVDHEVVTVGFQGLSSTLAELGLE
jgi:glutaredoxin